MKKFFRNNGLSIVFLLFFVITLALQIFTGVRVCNSDRKDKGETELSLAAYLRSGHFIEATFENWESEFLQMALFVTLSAFLYQKGSTESKDPDTEKDEEEKPNPGKKGAPWPVKKGGMILALYQRSLTLALFFLFVMSFLLHWYGSLLSFNEDAAVHGERQISAWEYLGHARLWFESFENWQSEFLSVFAIVVLSIFLRDKGSAQSKAVDAPDWETG